MSIYVSIPGVGDLAGGDDEQAGELTRYQGSHMLPAEDDPRGGHIGLAEIPSHITRDGRGDQPEDGASWPWLRLHVADVPPDDPCVILTPAQARHLAAQLTGWADSAAHDGPADTTPPHTPAYHLTRDGHHDLDTPEEL